MHSITLRIPDDRDHAMLLALLQRLGIEVEQEPGSHGAVPAQGSFHSNAKKHIASPRPGVSPDLSQEIDDTLYGR